MLVLKNQVCKKKKNPIVSIQTEVQDQPVVQDNQVDYSIFEVGDLCTMVSEVGVDTRGMDKLDLIRNCEKFRDLSKF